MKECTGHEKINMDQKETKKMKSVYKVCLLVLAMLPAAFSLGAQPKGERKDPEFWKKVQAEKVEFITKRMGLQKDASEAFLKAYNEYEEQKGRLFHERQEALRSLKKALKSKKNVQTLLKKYLEARANLDAWEMSDYEKFSEVLTDEQIARLIVAEEDFRREQIHRLNGERRGGPGMPPPDGMSPRGEMGPRGGMR